MSSEAPSGMSGRAGSLRRECEYPKERKHKYREWCFRTEAVWEINWPSAVRDWSQEPGDTAPQAQGNDSLSSGSGSSNGGRGKGLEIVIRAEVYPFDCFQDCLFLRIQHKNPITYYLVDICDQKCIYYFVTLDYM